MAAVPFLQIADSEPDRTEYCPCACDPPTVSVSARRRSAAGTFQKPGDPDNGEFESNIYAGTLGLLAAAEYVASGGDHSLFRIASVWTSNVLSTTDTTITSQINKTTEDSLDPQYPVPGPGEPPDPFGPHYSLETVVSEGKYKLRVDLPTTWKGADGTLTVRWRQMKTNSGATIVQAEPGYDGSSIVETAEEPSYENFSEDVTVHAGDTFVETSEYTINASDLSPGDTVYVTGPADLAKYAAQTGIALAVNFAHVATRKNGFPPYIRPHAATGNAEEAAAVEVYARETATTVPGSPDTYTGYQRINQTIQGNGVTPFSGTTFSANVPTRLRSTIADSANLDEIPAHASALSATCVTWDGKLVMTLSEPISTASMLAYAAGVLAAGYPFSNELGKRGVLALRNLPPDESTYEAQKSRRNFSLSLPVFHAIDSLFRGGDPLRSLATTITVKADVTTTNLDTGAALPPETISATLNYPGPDPSDYSAMHDDPVDVPVPGANLRVEFSKVRIDTETLARLKIPPQADILE